MAGKNKEIKRTFEKENKFLLWSVLFDIYHKFLQLIETR